MYNIYYEDGEEKSEERATEAGTQCTIGNVFWATIIQLRGQNI